MDVDYCMGLQRKTGIQWVPLVTVKGLMVGDPLPPNSEVPPPPQTATTFHTLFIMKT